MEIVWRLYPNKYFNIVSTLFVGWCDVATLNQRENNIVYVNVGIYNVEQHQINVVCFNVALNNVWQLQNNVVIFNVDIHNVELRWNHVVNMTIKKMKNKLRVKKIIILLNFNKNHLNWIRKTQDLHFVHLFKEHMEKNDCKAGKNLKTLWISCHKNSI